jgi:predicted O-methyltransferase YrrM
MISLRKRILKHASRLPGYDQFVWEVMVERRWGEVSTAEARFLGELVRQAPSGRPIIEIGTLFGTSTKVLTLFKENDTPLITVDAFVWNPLGISPEQHYRMTRAFLEEETAQHRVELVRMDKDAFYAQYDGPPPGLVFLDADHRYEPTKADITWAQSVGAAIISGHDYSADWPGVQRAVEVCGGARTVVGSVFVMNPSGGS